MKVFSSGLDVCCVGYCPGVCILFAPISLPGCRTVAGCALIPLGPLAYRCPASDPACTRPPWAEAVTWVILVIALLLSSVGFMTCLPVVQVMLVNVADGRMQGLTQGVAQSLSSLFRAAGPLACGYAFTFFTHQGAPYVAFAVLSAGYLLCAGMALFLSADVVNTSRK